MTADDFRNKARGGGNGVVTYTYGYFEWAMSVTFCCEPCTVKTYPFGDEARDAMPPQVRTIYFLNIAEIRAEGLIHVVPKGAVPWGWEGAGTYENTVQHERQHQKNAERFFDQEKERIQSALLVHSTKARCTAHAVGMMKAIISRTQRWAHVEVKHPRSRGFRRSERKRGETWSATFELIRKLQQNIEVRNDGCVHAKWKIR